MADDTKIIRAWFKSVELSVDSSSITGGIKNSVKQFPNRNTQTVDVFGLQPRKYSLDCIISDRELSDYFAYKAELLRAIESTDSGQLIHPIDGRLDNVYAVSYSIDEKLNEFGSAQITINFEVHNNTGIPQSSGNAATQIESLKNAVESAVNDDISSNFSVSDKFKDSFFGAVDKVNAIVDTINDSISFAGESSDTISEFTAEINSITENVNSLVKGPQSLADSITSIFGAAGSLYVSAETTFNVFTKMFGFGDDDIEIKQDTASRIERKSNADLLNGSVASEALSYCYLSAVQIEYQTTAQINDLLNSLDEQYNAIQDSTVSQAVKDAVTNIRSSTLDALNTVAVTTPRVITVETLPTTARLLAFDYYGDDDHGSIIADLNSITDVSFVEGSIDLVTL